MAVTKIPKKTVTVIESKQSAVVDKEKYRQLRVAAYCRVSTDSDEQLTSYATQKKVYTEMITAKKEWCFAGLYADEGISGTLADRRPEFKKMIDACLAGKIEYIITKSVSRFARNTVECLEYVRMLKARNIGVFFEEQSIDTLKADSELYLVIYAGFAQSESESMSKNITWSYRKNFEDGKVSFVYSRMLGYRKGDDGQPEIVPEEAGIVRNIFDMYLAGKTPREIVDALHDRAVSVPEKKITFSISTVQNILKNERYIGDAILQKTVTVDCISKTRKRNSGEAPMYYVSNNHPAIIDRDTFNRVQEELVRRKNKSPRIEKTAVSAQGRYSRYALTEVLKCAECGSPYKRCTWSKNGVKRIVWRCSNRVDNGAQFCKVSPTIDENKLHDAIVRAINRFNTEDSGTYLTLMKATIGEALGIGRNPDEEDLLRRRIDALNAKMLTMVSDAVNSGSSVESHEDEFRFISDEISQLQRRIEAIQQVTVGEDYESKVEQLQKFIDEHKCGIEAYDDTIVRQMVECVRVHSDGALDVIFGGGIEVNETIE